MKSVSDRLSRHFAACAAAAVAATAVTSGSEAAIVYSGIQNIAVPATTDGVYLNLITGANSSAPVAGWHINPWGTTGLRFGTNYPVPDTYYVGLTPAGSSSGGTAVNLALGSLIKFDGTSTAGASSMNAAYGWSYSGSAASFGIATQQWKLNSDNYLGVLALEGDGSVLKAWVRINVGATNLQRTIVDWGYELNGGDLVVGAVPSPGAAALLAIAGVVGRRRRA
jgi:hypothetical protein